MTDQRTMTDVRQQSVTFTTFGGELVPRQIAPVVEPVATPPAPVEASPVVVPLDGPPPEVLRPARRWWPYVLAVGLAWTLAAVGVGLWFATTAAGKTIAAALVVVAVVAAIVALILLFTRDSVTVTGHRLRVFRGN